MRSLAVVLTVALALRLPDLSRGLWIDEIYSVTMAGKADFVRMALAQNIPPLYSLWLRMGLWVSDADLFLRILSLVPGLATVAVVFRWMSRESRAAAWVAALALAVSPPFILQSTEVRPYALLLLFTALAFEGADRSDRRLALWASLAVLSHSVGIFLLPALMLYRWRRRGPAGSLLRWGAVPAALFAVFFLLHLHRHARGSWWMPELVPATLLAVLGEATGLTQVEGVLDAPGPVSARIALFQVLFALAVPLSAAALVWGDWRRSRPYLEAAALYLAGLAAYSAVARPVLVVKTVLPALIPLAGFLGVHGAGIRWAALRRWAVAGFAALALYFASLPFTGEGTPNDHRWRELGQWLRREMGPRDLLVFWPRWPEYFGAWRYAGVPEARLVRGSPFSLDPRLRRRFWRKMDERRREPFQIFLIGFPETHPAMARTLENRFGPPSTERFGRVLLHRFRSG